MHEVYFVKLPVPYSDLFTHILQDYFINREIYEWNRPKPKQNARRVGEMQNVHNSWSGVTVRW